MDDSTPTRPLPENEPAVPEPGVTEPIASHVPFTNVQTSTQPLGTPARPPRTPRNWAWVPIAAVLLAVAAISVTLAASGVFNGGPSGPLVSTPTPTASVTPTVPADDGGTVTEPSEPAPPAEPAPTEPAPESTEEPQPTEEPTPEPTP